MRISDWSSDVCSSVLGLRGHNHAIEGRQGPGRVTACLSHATADSQPPRGHPDMKFRHTLAAGVALIPVALLSTPAFAQSTGSVDFDDEIVVTGSATQDVGGIVIPNTPKAKQVLDQEIIRRPRPGPTVNDIVHPVQCVHFTNTHPWAPGAGGFPLPGFSADRISQTDRKSVVLGKSVSVRVEHGG